MNEEEAREEWTVAQISRCCSCHISAPCSFCVDGFSLDLDEYLELYAEQKETDAIDAYDRAMAIL